MSSLAQQALAKVKSINEAKKPEKINESTTMGATVKVEFDSLTGLTISGKNLSVRVDIDSKSLKKIADGNHPYSTKADFSH